MHTVLEMVPLNMVNDGYYNYPRIQISYDAMCYSAKLFINGLEVNTDRLARDFKVFSYSEFISRNPEFFREKLSMKIGFHENGKIMYENEFKGYDFETLPDGSTTLRNPVYKTLVLSELLKTYMEQEKMAVNEKGQALKVEEKSEFDFLEI